MSETMQKSAVQSVIQAVLESGTIQPGMTVVAGFSGGPDSLTMLHVLNYLKDRLPIQIIPVHINHGLRPGKCDEEQAHAEELCKAMGLDCQVVKADCKKLAKEQKISDEEAGRLVRYQAFTSVAMALEQNGIAHESIVIAVAQNADDQSETVLFRLMRGTGIHGLAGIRRARMDENGFLVVRPLLDVTREQVEGYIAEAGLEANHDESNEQPDYSRNKIRLELIPYLEQNYNAKIKESLRRLASIAGTEDDYMEQVAWSVYADAAELDTADEEVRLHLKQMAELHPAVIRRVVGLMLRQFGLDQQVSFALIDEVIGVMFSDNPSAKILLPGGLQAERRYDVLALRIPGDKEEEKTRDAADGMRLIASVIQKETFVAPEDRPYAAFDFAKFNKDHPGMIADITLRTRKRGDVIAIKNGTKKIQDVLVDRKVPQVKRDKVLMAAIGGEILWILPGEPTFDGTRGKGGQYSQKYQIDQGTEEVLFLEIIKPL